MGLRKCTAKSSRHTPRKRGIQYAAASRLNHCRLWNTGSPAFAGDDKRNSNPLELQSHQRRIAQDGAGNGDTLALAARQRHAALAELRLETLRQAADEFAGMRQIGGAFDLGIAGIGPAE